LQSSRKDKPEILKGCSGKVRACEFLANDQGFSASTDRCVRTDLRCGGERGFRGCGAPERACVAILSFDERENRRFPGSQ
jgi:hypothetical protein